MNSKIKLPGMKYEQPISLFVFTLLTFIFLIVICIIGYNNRPAETFDNQNYITEPNFYEDGKNFY